ncbi:hypothetical protein Tco_0081732, partial [Tanacetum coccineum]
FVMSSSMLNQEARSLFGEVSKLRGKSVEERMKAREDSAVFALKVENARLVKDLVGLRELFQLAESSQNIIKHDSETLPYICHEFEEKEAVMIAKEASFKTELEVLNEKLDLAIETRSLIVTDLVPHVVKTLLSSDSFSVMLADLHEKVMLVSREQALREVADMDIGLILENIRDYDPDAREAYDKVIDYIYLVEVSYLDLLAHHSERSLGFLKSLKPLALPLHKTSSVGPSSSPFL